MDMIGLITALSVIMWYLIDRIKPLWSEVKYGKYITIALAAVFGFALVFSFGLDLIVGLGLWSEVTLMGQFITGLTLMAGSSVVSEIIELIKK
mgnify:CR=1 FL=1|jgi:hypothetical protein